MSSWDALFCWIFCFVLVFVIHWSWKEHFKDSFWNCIPAFNENLEYIPVCYMFILCLSSVAQACPTPWTAAHQASLSIPTPGVYSNSCPSIQWWRPTISSSVIPFSSCLQYFPASGSFPMSQFFASGSQSIGASASVSASVLPMTIRDWFPLGLTGLITLQSKGL